MTKPSFSIPFPRWCAATALAAALAALPAAAGDSDERAVADALRRGAETFARLEREDVEKLAAALDVLRVDAGLVDRFRARDRDHGILVDKTHIDRKELARVRGEDRWDERPEVVLVDSTVWNERIIDLGRPLAEVPDGGVIIGRWRAGAKVFVGGAFPIRDARGLVVGALFVRHDVSKL